MSDLSGGDDSEWAELAAYAIEDPKLILYPAFPDEPIERIDLHVSRPFAILPNIVFTFIFGYSKAAIVLPAALFSTLSVLVLYLINRRLFNELVGLLSAFILAVSPFFLAFSRIGLLDASLVLSSLLALYLLVEAFARKKISFFYLSGFCWLINMTTTDIRGGVPILAVLPIIYFVALKKRISLDRLFDNVLFKHMLLAYLLVPIVYAIYISIPLLWGDSSWIDNLLYMMSHSVGGLSDREYLSFFDAVVQMGSVLVFTPFLGLIVVPFVVGLVLSIRKMSVFRYAFWFFAFIGVVFFYTQGMFAPHRQTIVMPAVVTFAALGLLWPLGRTVKRERRWIMPGMIGITLSYLFFMFYMFTVKYPSDFVGVLSGVPSLSGILQLLAAYWWVGVLVSLLAAVSLYLALSDTRLRRIYRVSLALFLILNLCLSFALVHTGVGIYKRTDSTGLLGSYLRENLGEEKYSCIAGVHAKSFSYYAGRTCIFWASADLETIKVAADSGNLKYFVLNNHYRLHTAGLGNTQPDGSLGPELGNESVWWINHYDKYSWLVENAEDITDQTGLEDGDDFLLYRLKDNR